MKILPVLIAAVSVFAGPLRAGASPLEEKIQQLSPRAENSSPKVSEWTATGKAFKCRVCGGGRRLGHSNDRTDDEIAGINELIRAMADAGWELSISTTSYCYDCYENSHPRELYTGDHSSYIAICREGKQQNACFTGPGVPVKTFAPEIPLCSHPECLCHRIQSWIRIEQPASLRFYVNSKLLDGNTLLKNANIRLGAGPGEEIAMVLPAGSAVEIMEDLGEWQEIKCPENTEFIILYSSLRDRDGQRYTPYYAGYRLNWEYRAVATTPLDGNDPALLAALLEGADLLRDKNQTLYPLANGRRRLRQIVGLPVNTAQTPEEFMTFIREFFATGAQLQPDSFWGKQRQFADLNANNSALQEKLPEFPLRFQHRFLSEAEIREHIELQHFHCVPRGGVLTWKRPGDHASVTIECLSANGVDLEPFHIAVTADGGLMTFDQESSRAIFDDINKNGASR